jgi:hypothetical protein
MARSGLSLADGQTYYVSVRAYDALGAQTAATSSAGVTVHTPTPAAPAPAPAPAPPPPVAPAPAPTVAPAPSAPAAAPAQSAPQAPRGSGGGSGGGGAGGGGGSSAGGGSAHASLGSSGGGASFGGSSGSVSTSSAGAGSASGSASAPAAAVQRAAASGATGAAPALTAQSGDGRLLVAATNATGATALSLSPVALTPALPAPTGRLRLLDSVVAVTATDPTGASLGAVPLTVTVVPSDAALAAVGGDATQLVLGYLDPTLGTWMALPTSRDAGGRLVAQAPQAGTLAVFRQAPTFWVVPTLDLPLTADGSGEPVGFAPAGVAVQIVATQGAAYQLQLGDGTLAWLEAGQVIDVPAPDALPPLPAPVPADPASASTDAEVALIGGAEASGEPSQDALLSAALDVPSDDSAQPPTDSPVAEAADLTQSEAN